MKQKYTILITKKRVGLLQRSYSRFKEFSLGCLVVARNGHSLSVVVIRCHSLSFVVPLVVTRCHSLSLVVPLVVIRYHSLSHSLSLVVLLLVIRCHSLSHSLSLVYHSLSFVVTCCHSLSPVIPFVVTRCTTRLSFYKRSKRSFFLL